MDLLFPGASLLDTSVDNGCLSYVGCVSLKKVKFETNLEHEYIQNFQLVKIAFSALGVQKV